MQRKKTLLHQGCTTPAQCHQTGLRKTGSRGELPAGKRRKGVDIRRQYSSCAVSPHNACKVLHKSGAVHGSVLWRLGYVCK